MKRPRPLADLLAPTLGPALAAQGFTGSDIVAAWTEILGERLAAASRPIRVEWPRRRPGEDAAARPAPATLTIRVAGAYALELQHMTPLILERVNAVYGWRCIGRIVLKQGPVGTLARPRQRRAEASAADRGRVQAAVEGVETEPLRLALARLGCAIAASGAPSTDGPSLPRSLGHPSSDVTQSSGAVP